MLHLLVFSLFLLAAFASSWPLIAHIRTHGAGEKFLNAAYIGRFLMELPLSEWIEPNFWQLNFPDAGSAVLVALPQFLLARALAAFMGTVAAMNLSLLLHHAAGGYAAFRLALRVWGPAQPQGWLELAGPLSAGFAFGASAHALAVFGYGQPENIGFVYLAVAAEAAWVLVREQRWVGLPWMLLAAVGAFTSSPYIAMAGLMAAWPFGLWVLLRARGLRTWVGALALLLVVGGLARHYSGAQAGEEGRLLCPAELDTKIPPERILALGEDPLTKLLRYPPIDHDVMVVDPVRLLLPLHERGDALGYYGGYLGFALLGLGALGFARLPLLGRLLVLASVAGPLVLSMGPQLVLHGWVPTWRGGVLELPLAVAQRTPALGGVFDTIQFPARLIQGAVLPLSMLVPLGVRALLQRWPRAPLAVAVAFLPLLEQLLLGPARPPLPLFTFDPPDAYVALREQPDELALVDVPPLGWDPKVRGMVDENGAPAPPPLNFTRLLVRSAWVHRRPVPYGGCMQGDVIFNATAQHSSLAREIAHLLAREPGRPAVREAAERLRGVGYGWLVLHPGTGLLSPDQEAQLRRVLHDELEQVYVGEDGTVLYRLP
ncbi:MAG: hypothetical protein H6741_25070 [Alphaproteobacteria bacterium]|nr:hypothetical protein [Alphaproteobacteria bacterium]MCB9795981.1 hypothetical protein [Alphaproteobacteria bacterium]